MIYNEILEKTGASSATISRVNRSLQYGADGYEVAFERLKAAGKFGVEPQEEGNERIRCARALVRRPDGRRAL